MRKNKPIKSKICLTCGKKFDPNSAHHKYCSDECRPSKHDYYINWLIKTAI